MDKAFGFDFEQMHYSGMNPNYNMLCCLTFLSISDFKLLQENGIITEDGKVMVEEWPTYETSSGNVIRKKFDFHYDRKCQVEELLAWVFGETPAPHSLKGCLATISECSENEEFSFDYDAVIQTLTG